MDLLLIGKTGNGKSSTGNSILGRIFFVSKSSTTSVTSDVSYEHAEYNGRVIKVVDGPGVEDTCGIEDLPKAMKLVMNAMQDAILLNPKGYHAFLLVVRYGGRFTAEDTRVIRILKGIFGQDFVKNFCILIVTCGENFDTEERQQNGKTFKSWCREQEGTFQELFQECDKRAILFYNKTNNEAIKEKQMNKLMQTIDRLQSRGQRYSDENFQMVHASRESLLLEVKEPIIREETSSQLSIILQRFEKISNENSVNKLQSLYELLKNTQDLYNRIVETDKGTGILSESLSAVKDIEITLVHKINDSTAEMIEMGKKIVIKNGNSALQSNEQLNPEVEMRKKNPRVASESTKRPGSAAQTKEGEEFGPGVEGRRLSVNVRNSVDEKLKERKEMFEKLGQKPVSANQSIRRRETEIVRMMERQKTKEALFLESLEKEQTEKERERLRIKQEREREIQEAALAALTCGEDDVRNASLIDLNKKLQNIYGFTLSDSTDESVSDEARIQNAWKAYGEMKQKYDNLIREQLPAKVRKDKNCPIL